MKKNHANIIETQKESVLLKKVRYKSQYWRALWPVFWLSAKGLAAVFNLYKGVKSVSSEDIDSGLDKLRSIGEFWRKNYEFDILGAIIKYQENIEKGHMISRGIASSKPDAIKYFKKANRVADNMICKLDTGKKWIVEPIRSESLTYLASVEWYKGDYISSKDHYEQAENIFKNLANDDIISNREENEKIVNIRSRMLAAHLTYRHSNTADYKKILSEMQAEYSKLATDIYITIRNGTKHDHTYCGTILKWLKQAIRDDKLKLYGMTVSEFELAMFRLDRSKVLKSYCVFMANYAWSKLYFGKNVAETHYLESADYLESCLNTAVSAFEIKSYTDYTYDANEFDSYLNNNHYDKDIQISVGRNLIYQLAALKSISLEERYNLSLDRLRAVLEKDKALGIVYDTSPVIGTIDAARANLVRIGLEDHWDKIVQDVKDSIDRTIGLS